VTVAPALINSRAVNRPIMPPPMMVISGVLVMCVGKKSVQKINILVGGLGLNS